MIKHAEPPPPPGISVKKWDEILGKIKTRSKGMKKTANTVIGPSEIAGKGLFATRGFSKGDIIAPVVDIVEKGGDMRPDLLQTGQGRYLNHSYTPNACNVQISDSQWAIRALRDIEPGEEITTDYREAKQAYPGAYILTPEEELELTKQSAYHRGKQFALYHVNLTGERA